MTDQKNPPRTREEQIEELAGEIGTFDDYDGNREVARLHVEEAEARGRAEALAELRAGAEPVAFVNLARLRWKLQTGDFCCLTFANKATENTVIPMCDALYAHPLIPREAELAARVAELEAVLALCREFIHAVEDVRRGGMTPSNRNVRRLENARVALAAAPETRG